MIIHGIVLGDILPLSHFPRFGREGGPRSARRGLGPRPWAAACGACASSLSSPAITGRPPRWVKVQRAVCARWRRTGCSTAIFTSWCNWSLSWRVSRGQREGRVAQRSGRATTDVLPRPAGYRCVGGSIHVAQDWRERNGQPKLWRRGDAFGCSLGRGLTRGRPELAGYEWPRTAATQRASRRGMARWLWCPLRQACGGCRMRVGARNAPSGVGLWPPSRGVRDAWAQAGDWAATCAA